MKRWIRLVSIVVCVAISITLAGCSQKQPKLDESLQYEAEGSFRYFWEQANTQEGSPGYGLVRDRYPGNPEIASMAATGFGLAAIPVGVEYGWIDKDEGRERAEKTMDSLLALENFHGFFYHFIHMQTGKREWSSEVSSIDTGILLCGVLTAGEYFGGEVKKKSRELYERVEWPWFVDPTNQMIYMSYSPEKNFAGHWDFYAEQLMLYILGAGSPTHPIGLSVYESFKRHTGKYGGGEPFIHSWFGSLFTYQFSHAWIDFRNLVDKDGVDWFKNSVDASLAAYQFSIDQGKNFKTLHKDSWGLTACDAPAGYNGLLGAPPSGYDNNAHQVDGTVAPCAAIGSIVFTPQQSMDALQHYLQIPELKGKYGLNDAYNEDKNWYGSDCIGIDKGISLLMIANYHNGSVWNHFMKNEYVKEGLRKLEFKEKDKS